jgi:hypothetical protein
MGDVKALAFTQHFLSGGNGIIYVCTFSFSQHAVGQIGETPLKVGILRCRYLKCVLAVFFFIFLHSPQHWPHFLSEGQGSLSCCQVGGCMLMPLFAAIQDVKWVKTLFIFKFTATHNSNCLPKRMAIKDSRKETRGCTFQPTISP